MNGRFFRYLVILIVLLSVPLLAAAETIKYGLIAPPVAGDIHGAEALAAYVKEKTNGRIEISVFPSGQLGSERSMASQVQSGSLQMATITTGVLMNFAPQVAVLDMPFLFPDRKTAYATLADPEVQEKVFSYLKPKGLVGIGWGENNFRDFSNTKRPVRRPEDLKGLKIRVMNSPLYIDTFEALGASPVAIPFPEVYSALQTGVIDGQDNPFLLSAQVKFLEVTKYETKTHHSLTELITVVNQDYWDSLSKDDQKIFREAAKIAIDTNRAYTADQVVHYPKYDGSLEDYAKSINVNVVELTPAEREKFLKAVQPVWNKYRKEFGDEIFDFMLAKIKEHSDQK